MFCLFLFSHRRHVVEQQLLGGGQWAPRPRHSDLISEPQLPSLGALLGPWLLFERPALDLSRKLKPHRSATTSGSHALRANSRLIEGGGRGSQDRVTVAVLVNVQTAHNLPTPFWEQKEQVQMPSGQIQLLRRPPEQSSRLGDHRQNHRDQQPQFLVRARLLVAEGGTSVVATASTTPVPPTGGGRSSSANWQQTLCLEQQQRF
jgi:hypothetical protein